MDKDIRKAIDDTIAHLKNHNIDDGLILLSISVFMSYLPKPQLPFEQAALYRKMTDME